MYLEFTEEEHALQQQLRTYFEDLVVEVEGSPSEEAPYLRYIRRMGQDGWLGLGWPTEYGGMARGAMEQMIFVEESHWAGVPLPLLTLNSVGPTIMSLGTDEQKRRLLPGILRGEVHFSIGYTEPSAGTDLASLKTRAVRDGDEYVINGQKIFTSAIQYADYVWLAVRTDPDAAKHKGLSVFIVPVDTPGFHSTPLPTIAGDITSSTFYEDVRVPVENLVGEENQGWKLITNQLNHERVAICPASGLLRSLTEVRRWAQVHRARDGRVLIDHEWVQISLARAHAKIEVLKLLNWKVAWASDKGLNPADASATKVYGTELALEVYGLLLEVVGQAGYLAGDSPGAVLRGRLENQARGQTIFTFGGGTNEIQRDIIAMIGLGMPRAPRSTASIRPPACAHDGPTGPTPVGQEADRYSAGVSRHFEYAVDRRYLPVLLPFLLRRSRDGVTLTDDNMFVATFGLVKLATPRANVTGAHVTTNYRWWTAVGARMSMADDGLTFGTNNRRGVCVHFDQLVRSSLRRKGHSALTVTVADVEGLVAALEPPTGLGAPG